MSSDLYLKKFSHKYLNCIQKTKLDTDPHKYKSLIDENGNITDKRRKDKNKCAMITFAESTDYAYGRIINHSLPQNTHNPFNMHKITKHKM